jgi:hypothetical protein
MSLLTTTPDQQEDGLIIERAVRLFINAEYTAARDELLKLSSFDPVLPPKFTTLRRASIKRRPRPAVTPAGLVPILRRDSWCCRYCGRRLVVAGVLELLGALAPAEFPFPRGHHLPKARTHPAAIRAYPEVDHVHAGSAGGDWANPDNLVAACVPCNEKKSDHDGWKVSRITHEDWCGLADLYRPLLLRAGVQRRYHTDWLRALDASSASANAMPGDVSVTQPT